VWREEREWQICFKIQGNMQHNRTTKHDKALRVIVREKEIRSVFMTHGRIHEKFAIQQFEKVSTCVVGHFIKSVKI